MNIITFGTFDLLHIGHIRLLKRAASYKKNGKLIVGVSSDPLNELKKRKSVFSLNERLEIVNEIKGVDEVFVEHSLEQKVEYIKKYKAGTLIMGDDWKGKFDYCKDSCPGLIVIYLPRTKGISTTSIMNKLSTL